jgi:hypothetical protein
MKTLVLAFALTFCCAPAFARFSAPFPEALEEAPIERAIENVAADRQLTPAQRERLLGRLHLIGYARGAVPMKRYPSGEWAPDGADPCDPAYRSRRSSNPCEMQSPPPELPQAPGPATAAKLAHLRAARVHYAQSLTMDGTDLRARLGLAFVLDELDRDDEARVELREIVSLGLPRLQRDWSDPEDHAVLSETVLHLSDLARSDADDRAIAQVRARLGASHPLRRITPIVVPLAEAPFARMIAPLSPVEFDFAGVGDRRARGWLTADAAWLVWDPEQRGRIDTGFQLIGQRTWGVFWTDGFEALRALDDNRDGELTGRELDGLSLWRDANGDGVSDAGKVRKLAAHGIVALAARGAVKRDNLIVAPAGVRLESGRTRPLYDWTPNAAPVS